MNNQQQPRGDENTATTSTKGKPKQSLGSVNWQRNAGVLTAEDIAREELRAARRGLNGEENPGLVNCFVCEKYLLMVERPTGMCRTCDAQWNDVNFS